MTNKEKLYTREEVNALMKLKDNDLKEAIRLSLNDLLTKGKSVKRGYIKEVFDKRFGDLGAKDEK